jgi:hypothetical protein
MLSVRRSASNSCGIGHYRNTHQGEALTRFLSAATVKTNNPVSERRSPHRGSGEADGFCSATRMASARTRVGRVCCMISSFLRRVSLRMMGVLPQSRQCVGGFTVCGTRAARGSGVAIWMKISVYYGPIGHLARHEFCKARRYSATILMRTARQSG